MLDALASPVALLLRAIHTGLSTFLAPASGPAWGLSIVLLTIVVRIVLFPLFVKQIKSQRRMQQLAPKIKELQARHKGDRETLNVEMMKLYKENNANPISGCLPLLLQIPVFFALFTVVREFGPDKDPRFGLSSELLRQGGEAKIFGAPIAAKFTSSAEELLTYGGSSTTVRVVSLVMIVLMGLTTFWTQRQMIARGGTTDPQQIMVQKLLLYVLPLSFAVFGVNFPVGVLLYWLTTNVWSMGQQAWVIKRMPPPVMGAPATAPKGGGVAVKDGAGKDGKDGKDGKSAKPGKTVKAVAPAEPASEAPTGTVPANVGGRSGGTTPRPAAGGANRRPAGSRKNKGRRGGRR